MQRRFNTIQLSCTVDLAVYRRLQLLAKRDRGTVAELVRESISLLFAREDSSSGEQPAHSDLLPTNVTNH